jgi:hypothetical protein
MLRENAWPNLEPINWDLLAKQLWKGALDDPSAAVLVPSPYSLAVVGVHPTLRVTSTLTIYADEIHH